MKIQKILKRLLQLHPKGEPSTLIRIKRLLKDLHSPENEINNVIQVVGTNGKHSFCVALREIVEKAGYNVTVGSTELNRYKLLEGLTEDVELSAVEVNDEDNIEINGSIPDLVLLNNDLTGGKMPGLSGTVLPRKEMGW